ncbi:MAG: Fic family protein, partial [Gemmatimonadaceae bacterium]
MPPLERLAPERFETPAILKKVATAGRQLAELKGVAASIPNQAILINSLGLQEAKDSSAIENIVTTHDELFRDLLVADDQRNPAAKEVLRYSQALGVGFDAVRQRGLLTNNHIVAIQGELERNNAGFRKLPGTALKDQDGRVIYTPPDPERVVLLMAELEHFINDDDRFPADPLIKMALIHHRFETIHPFYDGNGRTGRIVNVLYLVKQGLLDLPLLYMSRYIVRTKSDYYRLLQEVRELDAWEEWVLYLLTAVEDTTRDGIATVEAIRRALLDTKHRIREAHKKIYSQDLINTIFTHPYTKIQFIQDDLDVSRLTATRYLEALTKSGFLAKHRIGRTNYY